jgi:predicted permease
MPEARRQFRVLYRDFLTRLVDLEILSAGGDVQRLLVQFAAMLAAASFTYAVAGVPRYVQSTLPLRQLLVAAWSEQEFLIASTMAIAGLFGVLAWNTVLPDRRDCLVLGLLPVRVRIIFLAKMAAIGTALGISVAAVNSFTGFSFPFLWGGFRTLCAWWLTQLLAGLLVSGTLLALQAVASQVLRYRLFLRASSFLQLASFFVILGVWFLKPPFTALAAHPWLSWMPSFWFFGLFQQLNGGATPRFAALAARALWSLPVVFAIGVAAFALAYRRNLRRIVEQPDIAPADRSRPATRTVSWLAARVLPARIERAVLLFTVRSIARSRQHRLILAAYAGIALAIGLAYTRDLIYGPSSFDAMLVAAPWNQPNGSFLAASMIALFFAVIGARAVFAMPIALRANWIFRLTAVHSPEAYFHAVRKALYTVAAIPVCMAAAAVLFTIWPAWAAVEHVALLGVLGILLVELSLYRFRKIPFACSYLPGKANLNVRLGTWGIGFLFVAAQGVHLEFWTMQSLPRYAVLFGILLTAAVWARRRTNTFAASPANQLLFEELPVADIHALDLRRDTVYPPPEQYQDPFAGIPSARPLSILEPAYVPPPAEPFHLRTAIEQLLGDLRYGTRILTKSPGFSAAAIALIAVGIGGNTAVYSLVHAILSKPAPGVRASGLVTFAPAYRNRPDDPANNSYPNFRDYSTATRTMSGLLAFRGVRFTAGLPDGTYELRGMMVTRNYFDILGVRLVRGRAFTAQEARGAAALPAIITYQVWQNQLHGDADVIGRPITLNGHTATIVGIGPPQFAGSMFAPNLEVAVPLEAYARLAGMEDDLTNRAEGGLGMVGRIAPGTSLSDARAEFAAIAARLAEAYPEVNRDRTMLLEPYSATRFGPVSGAQNRLFMAILMGVALLTLLMVCANVANLMLSRAVTRQREMAVRQSIGASRSRILRILLAEGLILSLAAAGAALIFAQWACAAIAKLGPPLESGGRFVPDFAPDWRVALYAVALAILSTLVFTLAPALRAWGQDLLPWLRGGEHSVAPGRSRTANLLVVAQLALCVVLVTSGSFAWRSTRLMESADLGFTRDHVLLAGVDTRVAAGSRAQNLALLERMRQRLLVLPGVAGASWAVAAPPHSHGFMDIPVDSVPSDGTYAGPDYLHTLRVPILAGRDFSSADLAGRGTVAIVNRKLAHTLWPGQSAVGRTVTMANSEMPLEVIGVVPDAAFNAVGKNGDFSGFAPEDRRNYIFLFESLHGTPGGYTFHVPYKGQIPAVNEVDNRVPVYSVRTLQTEFEEFTLPVHTFANFVGISAAGALLLASLGLYAVIAFYTARRRRELGIRVALGASPGQVLQSVLREGLLLTGAGLTIGLALSAAAARAFGSLLYGISPGDPGMYGAVAAALATVSLVACYLPARKAARCDAMESLRQE